MQVREEWNPKVVTATGVLTTANGSTSGVLCTTDGTFAISEGVASGGATVVDTVTAVAGTWYPLPFKYSNGAFIIVASGFEGTFGVS